MYLLGRHEYDFSTSRCIKAEHASLDTLDPIGRTEQGIRELEAVVSQPSGVVLSQTELRLEMAAAKTALSKLYLASGNLVKADRTMQDAVASYLLLSPKDNGASTSQSLITKIAIGLIRCGKGLDALRELNRLPINNPDRAYLSAEIFFNLGSREISADKYEQWIALGCKSELVMLTNDEYGSNWTFLLEPKPKDFGLCEQLPVELRSRFDSLFQQFAHPNNLPTKNFPSILFRHLSG
jgi:hypothetical protein